MDWFDDEYDPEHDCDGWGPAPCSVCGPRRREPTEYEWETKEGKIINIREMEDRHLKNAIKMVYRKKRIKAKPVLLEEAYNRGLLIWKDEKL